MLFGVDVSHHNTGTFDWAAARRAGIEFATAKACEGTTFRDATFGSMLRGAWAAGMVVGGYHVLRTGNVAGQVDMFLQCLAEVGDPATMIHQLDYEKWTRPDGSLIDFPSYATLAAFVAEHRRRTGGHPLIVYCGAWIWEQVRDRPANAAKALGCPLWDSRYVAGPAPYLDLWGRVPSSWWTAGYGGWPQSTVLQFTSTGRVPGIPGVVDVNAYRGTRDQLAAQLTGGTDDMDPGTEIPQPSNIAYPDGTTDWHPQLAYLLHMIAADTKKMFRDQFLAEAAEVTRDAAAAAVAAHTGATVSGLRAAFDSLVAAVNTAGGNVEAASILARIDEQAAAIRADVDARADQQLAAARTRLERIVAALAEAAKPEGP